MWPNPQENADLARFTVEIFNGKIHFCTMYDIKKIDDFWWTCEGRLNHEL